MVVDRRALEIREADRIDHDADAVGVDLDVIRTNYQNFAKALPDTRVFYAVKANPSPEVLALLASIGLTIFGGGKALQWVVPKAVGLLGSFAAGSKALTRLKELETILLQQSVSPVATPAAPSSTPTPAS